MCSEDAMASRMSNRDRIQRMAQEAEAAKKEKTVAAKAKPKKKVAPKKAAAKKKTAAKKKPTVKKAASRKKAAVKGRVKIVWAVCVPAGKALKIFPFREKAEAQAEAEKLTAKKGTLHVVRSERQPMEADE